MTVLSVPASQQFVPVDSEQLPLPRQVNTLLGHSAELQPLVLRSVFARTRRLDQLGILVGDNRFDAYTLARLGAAHGIDPWTLTAQVEVSRAFTCHQLHHRVTNLSIAKLFKWSALYVLGFLELFYDEDIAQEEARRLLVASLARLKELAAGGWPVLITMARPPSKSNRDAFVEMVVEASDAYWEPSTFALSEPVLQQLEFAMMNR
jgi:hypothetical protein